MSDIAEQIAEQIEKTENSKLNGRIAILVSIAASLIAVFNIKGNNIVQAMSQAQVHALDAWSFYQAKSVKQHLAENNRQQLELQLVLNKKHNSEVSFKIEELIKKNSESLLKYENEKAEIKKQAEEFQLEYDRLNIHDDQFDLAEALLSLGLSVLGVTALVKKKPLFYFGSALILLGAIFGLAGFLNLNLHPDFVTALLS